MNERRNNDDVVGRALNQHTHTRARAHSAGLLRNKTARPLHSYASNSPHVQLLSQQLRPSYRCQAQERNRAEG
jgi:hypothetical protein